MIHERKDDTWRNDLETDFAIATAAALTRKFTDEWRRKNLAATGQPRPKYRTALVDSEMWFFVAKSSVACAHRHTREILFLFPRQDIANVFLKLAIMYSWVHARRTFLFEKTREHEGYILFETFGI